MKTLLVTTNGNFELSYPKYLHNIVVYICPNLKIRKVKTFKGRKFSALIVDEVAPDLSPELLHQVN